MISAFRKDKTIVNAVEWMNMQKDPTLIIEIRENGKRTKKYIKGDKLQQLISKAITMVEEKNLHFQCLAEAFFVLKEEEK